MTADDSLPNIDFSTFLLSLGTSAMIHLGDASDAEGNQQMNLPLAKQTIDIMSMLAEKTEGNLTGEEKQLLDEQLYTLRMRYLDALKGK